MKATSSTLDEFAGAILPEVEKELHRVLESAIGEEYGELEFMLAYHLGWKGEKAGGEAQGKRVRPLLLLLSAASAGGDWRPALPAATAVELVHNFSLIHDDIQDKSPTRRGRPTLWTKWGQAQAINSGDSMFALAFLAAQDLEAHYPAQVTVRATRLLTNACIQLTQGQFLDLSYESMRFLPLEAYWAMIEGKTASLLAACTELGALLGGADETRREAFRQFGRSLGLAFQVQDDLLGIWGDAGQTGKSVESDLVTGKKSLPVVYGLSQNDAFARRWGEGAILPEEVPSLAQQLSAEGAYGYAQDSAQRLTEEALRALEAAAPDGDARAALRELALKLLHRQA